MVSKLHLVFSKDMRWKFQRFFQDEGSSHVFQRVVTISFSWGGKSSILVQIYCSFLWQGNMTMKDFFGCYSENTIASIEHFGFLYLYAYPSVTYRACIFCLFSMNLHTASLSYLEQRFDMRYYNSIIIVMSLWTNSLIVLPHVHPRKEVT